MRDNAAPVLLQGLAVTDSAQIPCPTTWLLTRAARTMAAVFQQDAEIGIRFNGKERF